jgi:hypothetical protein
LFSLPVSFRLPRSLRVVLITLLVPAVLIAQVVGGSIGGVVTDPSGAAVRGAAVVIHNTETGIERTLTSGSDGRYTAPSLPIGRYNVSVTADGFGPQQRSGVVLTVGQSNVVDVTLTVGSISQTVVIDAAPPTINLSTQQTSGLVDERQVKELPLNGRSYDQLITLNPGAVNYTGQRSGGVGTSNSSVGNMFAISGRRPQDNLFLLNGIEYTGASLINVTPGGTSGQLLGVDAVREFNVVTDTYSASYGKRDGAQISIVTASGTNSLHGDAYEFHRNSFFDARNYFDPARIPNFQRNNYGLALGGPIKKDKLFLFGNYEGYRQNLGISGITLVPDNASRAAASPAVKPLLNLFPVGTVELGGGIAEALISSVPDHTQHIREDFGTTRLDANLTANDLLFAVYTVDDSVAHSPTSNPLSLVDEALREQVVSVQEQHVFSPHLLNTARLGYSRASFYFLGSAPADIQAITSTFIPGKPTGAIVIAGSTASNGASQVSAGANVGSNNAITRNLFTFDDHVYWSLGRHQIEAGVWLQRLQSNDNLAQDQYGQASFASIATFLTGAIKTFTYVPAPTELGWRALFADAYLEDTFHLTPRIEIRAGIRTESSTGWSESQGRAGVYNFNNGVIDTNPTVQSNALTDNRALFLPEPRLGVAWNVSGDNKTAIHASVGLHHSLLDALDYRLDQAAPFNTVYSYSNTTVTSPTAGTASVSPSTVATDMATPSVLAYTVRVERELAPATSLAIVYNGSHSSHQILSGDLNEPAFTIQPNGTVYYPTVNKLNPALANSTSWWSGGSGNYNALVVDFRHDLAHGLQFRANYTWSKNLDDGSAWNTSVSANTPAFVAVPSLPHLDYGPAATDIRHIAAFNGSYQLPFGSGQVFFGKTGPLASRLISGWTLSTIASLQTGFPFSPQLGYNPTGSGDSRNPVRPDLNPNFRGSLYTKGGTSARVAQSFNPNAFSAPAYGTVGNLGRDTLTGPGYADWDLSLLKSTQLTERTHLQFRAEFFNVLNHTNLQTPNEVVYTSGPTQGTAANQTAPAVLSPTAGVITSTAGTSRQIQLGAKIIF